MLRISAICCLFCALCFGLTPATHHTVSLIYENDVFTLDSPDRYYTSGFALVYTTPEKEAKERHSFFRNFDMLAKRNDEKMIRFSYGLTHTIFTPAVHSNEFLRNDRPFSAILAFIAGVETRRENSLQNLSLYLGAVGKLALGKQVQNGVHSITDNAPWSWEHQIPNDIYAQISYAYIHRFGLGGAFGIDALPFYNLNIGNYQANAQIGSYVRVGYGLSNSFMPSRFHYGAVSAKIGKSLSVYGFGGVRGILVGFNRLITGPTPSFNDLNLRHFMHSLEFGLSVSYKALSFTASWVYQDKEFKEQQKYNTYGSLGLSVVF